MTAPFRVSARDPRRRVCGRLPAPSAVGYPRAGRSPALRAEYTRRAGLAAAYREAAGITNPGQAVSVEPHRGNPELEAMRKAVLAALEIRDEADIIRSLDRNELEARALQGQRAQAAAPPDASRQLRLTAQAEAEAHQQAADAHTRHDHTGAASATALVMQLAAERQRLEAANARYEQWSAGTRVTRDAAGKAAAELRQRGYACPDGGPHLQPEDDPQLTAGSWQQLEADAEAMNCGDASEHRAASNTGNAGRHSTSPVMNSPLAPAPEAGTSPENEPAQENRAARLDELLARADQAAQRLAARQAERYASSQYAVRTELQAQAQAEAGQQAQARDEAEIER